MTKPRSSKNVLNQLYLAKFMKRFAISIDMIPALSDEIVSFNRYILAFVQITSKIIRITKTGTIEARKLPLIPERNEHPFITEKILISQANYLFRQLRFDCYQPLELEHSQHSLQRYLPACQGFARTKIQLILKSSAIQSSKQTKVVLHATMFALSSRFHLRPRRILSCQIPNKRPIIEN